MGIHDKQDEDVAKSWFNQIIDEFNTIMSQTRFEKPSVEHWQDVIDKLSQLLITGFCREHALYMRARAYYYSGLNEKAIVDLDNLIKLDPYNSIVNTYELPPKRLRAMAKIALGRFSEAEADLQYQIDLLNRGAAGIPGADKQVQMSLDYYWLLVCKYRGDEEAAWQEQQRLTE